MPATLTLEPAPAHHGSNGRHQPHRHDHPRQEQQHPPRPHVPDPALLIQQYIDPGNAQSYLDLAREHGLDLDELIAFFDHPDTLHTLDGLDRISRRRAESIAATALPQALQTLTQITYLPTHGAPATTIEAVRKSATELARLSREYDADTTHHTEDESPPPPPSIASPSLPAAPAGRRETNPRVTALFGPSENPSPREGAGGGGGGFPSSPPSSSALSSETPSLREGAGGGGGGFPSSPPPSPALSSETPSLREGAGGGFPSSPPSSSSKESARPSPTPPQGIHPNSPESIRSGESPQTSKQPPGARP